MMECCSGGLNLYNRPRRAETTTRVMMKEVPLGRPWLVCFRKMPFPMPHIGLQRGAQRLKFILI